MMLPGATAGLGVWANDVIDDDSHGVDERAGANRPVSTRCSGRGSVH